jgi:hypothetical protein
MQLGFGPRFQVLGRALARALGSEALAKVARNWEVKCEFVNDINEKLYI